jgi:hypothetical protein
MLGSLVGNAEAVTQGTLQQALATRSNSVRPHSSRKLFGHMQGPCSCQGFTWACMQQLEALGKPQANSVAGYQLMAALAMYIHRSSRQVAMLHVCLQAVPNCSTLEGQLFMAMVC